MTESLERRAEELRYQLNDLHGPAPERHETAQLIADLLSENRQVREANAGMHPNHPGNDYPMWVRRATETEARVRELSEDLNDLNRLASERESSARQDLDRISAEREAYREALETIASALAQPVLFPFAKWEAYARRILAENDR